MKTHRKLFFIYCQIMLIIILSKQLIDVYFRNEVTEFLVFRIVATLVYLIVGALVLTSMEIRTKKVK
ncbi:hypothetical protein J2X77_004050 [Sphingobacterium sp. 2149]|nr:hypothetical protein [Sphingobacterium sp. 2149]